MCLAGRGLGAEASRIALPEEHRRAVRNRRCRIVVQHDAHDVLVSYAKRHGNEAPFEPFRDAVFAYVDDPLTQIDSIWWDVAGDTPGSVYPSKMQPPTDLPLLQHWQAQGIDWIAELVRGTRARKREVFWNHRISEVNGKVGGGLEMEHLDSVKAAHPDWVTPASFWWQGMWNLAAPGLREYKVNLLRELATNYDLDGIQIDFARHVPCLPNGRQWELRGEATEFMRMVRAMTLEVAGTRGRPMLVAARVPQTLSGCKIDGFDVETWAREGLVDILALGSRTIDVETERFREAVGEAVQLQPCFDDHHATDGYRHPPIEVLRGVFANHWERGANSVMTFNWATGLPELCRSIGCEEGPLSQRDAYREVGSMATMSRKDKVFAVERRGGYPWADGFFNRNDTAPLPAAVGEEGAEFQMHVSDPPAHGATLTIRLILWGAGDDAGFEVKLNGTVLINPTRDPAWKDSLIFSPAPQPTSGAKQYYRDDPKQRLLRIEYPVATWRQRANTVTVRSLTAGIPGGGARLEKLEGWLRYSGQG